MEFFPFFYISKPIDWKVLEALDAKIDVDKTNTFFFSVQMDEQYYISLEFMQLNSVITDSINKLAFNDVGAYQKILDFDFDWKLYENKTLVALGNGNKCVKGMISNTIIFADFGAKTDTEYKIEFIPGEYFIAFKNISPKLKIAVSHASVSTGIAFGHALMENYSKPIGIVLIILGSSFIFFTFLFYKLLKRFT